MHLSMSSPTIPHPGYTRAKWGFDNIKYEIPTPLGTPCCQMPLLRLLMLWDLTILHVKTLPLGQLVGIKSPCIAPLYPRWGIVGLNIDRCISGQQKLERQIITQVCGYCQPHSWMVSCPTVHSDDQPVSSGNQCTYIDTMMPIK